MIIRHACSTAVVLIEVVHKVCFGVFPLSSESSSHGMEGLNVQLTLENADGLVYFKLVCGADFGKDIFPPGSVKNRDFDFVKSTVSIITRAYIYDNSNVEANNQNSHCMESKSPRVYLSGV